MKALVLSGGSIKGAFQAGAISAILKSGFIPEYIFGVSVGSLNGAFLINHLGEAIRTEQEVDWPKYGEALKDFWIEHIRKPSSLVKRKSRAAIGWAALTGKFNGFVDTSPLQKLVTSTISYENMLFSNIPFNIGTVNLADGEFLSADVRYPNFIDYIIASTAIPIVMPISFINGAPFVDGGLRDITPLNHAIKAGATEIIVVTCQATKLQAVDFKPKNLFSLVNRVQDILLDEVLQNDIKLCSTINKHLPVNETLLHEGVHAGKRRIDIKVIRPLKNPDIDILNFKSDDIKELIQSGIVTANLDLIGSNMVI